MRNRQHRTTRRIVPLFRRSTTCGHMGCDRPATDRCRGVRVCMDHFFVMLQREVAAR